MLVLMSEVRLKSRVCACGLCQLGNHLGNAAFRFHLPAIPTINTRFKPWRLSMGLPASLHVGAHQYMTQCIERMGPLLLPASSASSATHRGYSRL